MELYKMDSYIIQTYNLTKTYSRDTVLNNVSIKLEKGHIYGFVGQNGAGKTTLLRLILGLSFPTSGNIELFGSKTKSELELMRKRIGSIIETPCIYPDLTAFQNLEICQLANGHNNKEFLQELLYLVGLSDIGKKKAKNFSMGMKQRLGIAIALLNNPDLLLLDEPINGLDPTNILEVRELLKKLCKDKKITILISSHILSELQHLATDYIFIHKGNIIQNLSLAELENKCRMHISIKVNDTQKAISLLEGVLKTTNFEVSRDGEIKVYEYQDKVAFVSETFSSNGLILSKIAVEGDNLEDYYHKMIDGGQHA